MLITHKFDDPRYEVVRDTIVVLSQGAIIEQGDHDQLIRSKGAYYNLVKDQLSLGE